MLAARKVFSWMIGLGAIVPLAGLAGCSTAAESGSQSSTVGTVSGVGGLPPVAVTATASPTITTDDSVTDDSVTLGSVDPDITTTTVNAAQRIGVRSAGNRVLMIGDSITASISERYGGQACDALVPLGWKVEVDAETGRFIDFGKKVLDQRLSAGWDAAIVFLGNNYGYDKTVYQAQLHAMLLRLVPMPTVLINTTMFRPQQQDVNDAINEEAALFTSVSVIDWASVTVDPGLTGGDGLHLTESGRRALAYQLADIMGPAPTQPGECLTTKYRDDSAGSPSGPPGNQSGTKTPTKPTPKPTPTTKPASTGTTASGTNTSTTPTTSKPTTSSTPDPTPTTPAPTTPTPTTPAPTTPTPTTPAPTTPTTQPNQ